MKEKTASHNLLHVVAFRFGLVQSSVRVRVGTEVDSASSHPAPHTAVASTAEAPERWRPLHQTDVTVGTPEMGDNERRACLYLNYTLNHHFLLM